MGKTRDLFKKIRDTKGTFLAKMGSIKDRNGMDLIEAVDIKKRWQKYTNKLTNKHSKYKPRYTGLENVSFHSNPKERQCQRMLKLPHNCAHLTR